MHGSEGGEGAGPFRPLSVGAGHARENSLNPEFLSQTIMTGIWSPPLMKIIPSPPRGVRGAG